MNALLGSRLFSLLNGGKAEEGLGFFLSFLALGNFGINGGPIDPNPAFSENRKLFFRFACFFFVFRFAVLGEWMDAV